MITTKSPHHFHIPQHLIESKRRDFFIFVPVYSYLYNSLGSNIV